MARTIDQLLRDTVGGLVIDSVMKQVAIEELQEKLIAAQHDKLTEAQKEEAKVK